MNDRLGTDYGGPNTIRPDHTGVDLQADIGDTVASMAAGRVVGVGIVGGTDCGTAVKIVHTASGINGTSAFYCHLSSTSVMQGEYVIAGQDIGTVGMTGSSTGPHLHITLKSSNGAQRLEYFNYVDKKPKTAQLDPDGC